MTETWQQIEAALIARAERDAALIRERLARDEAMARAGLYPAPRDPAHVLDQCGSIGVALADLERIHQRSPDPDSRAWARAAINSLRRIWEPGDE